MDPYEWDEAKNAANVRKHGIGFELVRDFDWSVAVILPDRRSDYGEDRFLAYGRLRGKGYAVVFTPRGERTRIISIRRMHEKELLSYGL
jgi:uncharacterized DUF497 family protein